MISAPIGAEPLTYKVGTDCCFDQPVPGSKHGPFVELRCDLLNERSATSLSPAIPPPSATWLHNNSVVYDEDGMNLDFFMSEALEEIYLPYAPMFIYPTSKHGLRFDLRPNNLTSDASFQEALFDLVFGPWTCVLNNSYGAVNATTIISSCSKFYAIIMYTALMKCIVPIATSGSLSFQGRNIFANESTGKVEVCVHHTGTIRQFQLYSIDGDAKCNYIVRTLKSIIIPVLVRTRTSSCIIHEIMSLFAA